MYLYLFYVIVFSLHAAIKNFSFSETVEAVPGLRDQPSDILGDHALVCGFGGERIARHNFLRDALHETAVAAGLAPTKEGRALIPGTNLRPADIFIPHWAGGRDAALDVTVTHPLLDRTRAGTRTCHDHSL